jgi:hypothetical protein
MSIAAKPKTFIAPNQSFELVCPDHWQIENHGTQLAVFDPDGVGALVVSSMLPPSGVIPDAVKIMQQFVLEHKDAGISVTGPKSKNSSDCPSTVAHAIDVVNGKSWRHWVFTNRSRAVIFSYNCNKDFARKEDPVLETIIDSVRLSP